MPKQIDPLDRVARFSDLTTGPPQPQLTAVPRAWRDVCGGGQGAPGCGDDPIRVFWPTLPEQSWNDRWLECRRRPPFPCWIVQDRGSDFREDCPATPTIPARILLEPTEADDAAIEVMIADGVVFYGAYCHGAADAMSTPLHDDLPAVFLHSTAFDNLVTLGPDALRHGERTVPLRDVSLPDLLLPALSGAVFIARRSSSRLEA